MNSIVTHAHSSTYINRFVIIDGIHKFLIVANQLTLEYAQSLMKSVTHCIAMKAYHYYIMHHDSYLDYFCITLTLRQWSSSGNPVAIQCAWHLDPRVHWNATGERILVASVLPVVFQWSSSGFALVFQCVPIMQINTGSPLGNHWVLASASVVPAAFQCTCGSSGLPVCSNYAN